MRSLYSWVSIPAACTPKVRFSAASEVRRSSVILTSRNRYIPAEMGKSPEITNSDIVTRACREMVDGLGDLAEASLDSSQIELIFDEFPVVRTITSLYQEGL